MRIDERGLVLTGAISGEYLIRAMTDLQHEVSETNLVIVGDGLLRGI
jgi:glycerate kinase